jgi:hypothetical protein
MIQLCHSPAEASWGKVSCHHCTVHPVRTFEIYSTLLPDCLRVASSWNPPSLSNFFPNLFLQHRLTERWYVVVRVCRLSFKLTILQVSLGIFFRRGIRFARPRYWCSVGYSEHGGAGRLQARGCQVAAGIRSIFETDVGYVILILLSYTALYSHLNDIYSLSYRSSR